MIHAPSSGSCGTKGNDGELAGWRRKGGENRDRLRMGHGRWGHQGARPRDSSSRTLLVGDPWKKETPGVSLTSLPNDSRLLALVGASLHLIERAHEVQALKSKKNRLRVRRGSHLLWGLGLRDEWRLRKFPDCAQIARRPRSHTTLEGLAKIRFKDGRMTRIAPQRRPHCPAVERMARPSFPRGM